MKITLDRVALKALVDADPDFELQLKSAVLSELARRVFEKDFSRMVREVEPDLYARALETWRQDADMVGMIGAALRSQTLQRTSTYYSSMEASGEVKEKIDQYATQIRDRAVAKAVADFEKAYGEAIQRAVDAKLKNEKLEERINNRVERLVEEEINRRCTERFNERMAVLLEGVKASA